MRLEGRVAIVTGSASRQQGGEASSTMTLLRVMAAEFGVTQQCKRPIARMNTAGAVQVELLGP